MWTPGPEPEPEHYPADHQHYHHDRRAHHDADHQPHDDADCHFDPAGLDGAGAVGGQVQPEIFPRPAKSSGSVNGQVEEVYSGHNVVKAFNREDAVLNDFDEANNRLFESAWKSQFLSG